MQQGLQESNAALQAAQSQLSTRQEEVLELTQHLEAAQADIASLQVSNQHSTRHACIAVPCRLYMSFNRTGEHITLALWSSI